MRFQLSDPEIAVILDLGDQPHKIEGAVRAIVSGRLANALDRHATATAAAVEKITEGAARLSSSMSAASEKIVGGMQAHGERLVEAATASDRYSRRLVWATVALVLATAALFAQPFIVAWMR